MIETRNSTIMVSRTIGKASAGEPEDTKTISVHRFETVPAEVEVTLGLTIGLPNYSSAKISVSVKMPCYKEEIEEAYRFVEKFVTDKVEAERNEIVGHKDKKTVNPF